MIRRVFVTILLLIAAFPVAASKERNLDHWFDRELIPFVRQQLIEHPRFRNETVMFVVFDNGAPAPVTNQLALSLRDRLLDAALHTPGLQLGWQQGQNTTPVGSTSVDCTRDAVHYYVGIELSQHLDGSYAASVRAIDLEDRSWVTGFGRQWQGQLTIVQRRALQQAQTDQTFLGSRDVPFNAEQTDLLAAHLAHKMACELLRGSGGGYVVATNQPEAAGDMLAETVQLVGNNLAGYATLAFARTDEPSNAQLSGKAHRIDGDLFQYWLNVTPTETAGELVALSTSAYVSLPDRRTAATSTASPPDQTITVPRKHDDALLGRLRVLPSSGSMPCRKCSVLSAQARADAVVFLLQHQANFGLVRLGSPECRRRTAAHLVTAESSMELPIPFDPVGHGDVREAADWLVSPGAETYYAIAVTDSRAARMLANHLDKLPMRCTDAVRLGLTSHALQRWLAEFARLAERAAPHVDWRAIEVRDVM